MKKSNISKLLVVLCLAMLVVFSTFTQAMAAGGVWTTKDTMTTSRYSCGSAEVDGKLYVIGGYTSANICTGTVEVYDPATNQWSVRAAMPTARAEFGIAVVNNMIYVIGGNDNVGPLNVVEMYNPATNTWTWKPSMPTTRSNLAAAAVGTKIYAIGGIGNNTIVEEFDTVTNAW